MNDEPQPIPEYGGVPRLVRVPAEAEMTCRCGSRIRRGEAGLKVAGLPGSVEGFVHGRLYCSARCVRAGFLEDLSVLDALDTAEAEAQVIDLRETYLHLASAFSKLLEQPPGPGSAPDRTAGGSAGTPDVPPRTSGEPRASR